MTTCTAPAPTGWRHDPVEVSRALATLDHPHFGAAATHLMGSGRGRTTLLYKAWKDATGAYVDYPAQVIGCCVSRGFAHGIDLLQCVDIVASPGSEAFVPTSHEVIYGLARVDIGGMHGSYQDGAVGAWAAQAVRSLGTVAQDLVGPYDDARAREWGASGVPEAIKARASDHKVRTTSLVSTFAELEDALANGYPVTVCSNQGFTLVRDRQGFCAPQGTWAHCMLIVGVRNDDRPGACIFQSWGAKMPSGTLALDQPPNSFWADRAVVERMLGMGDSWAISQYEGYRPAPVPAHWTYENLF